MLDPLECQHFVDQICAVGGDQDGGHEVASLGHDFFAAHGIFGGAAHSIHALAQVSAVGEGDFDDGYALGQQLFEFGIGDELNFLAFAKDRRIVHTGIIVRGPEGRGLVDQHHGQHILKANVWNLAVIHHTGFVGGNPHSDLLYLIGLEGTLFANVFQLYQGGLNGCSVGPLLVVGANQLVTLAEYIDNALALNHEV